MTIRLRCAECQRKLKVPDEALGKKVQCPVCGARFIGRLEANPSQEPVVPEPVPASSPAASFPNLQLEEPSSLEAIEPLASDEPIMEETVLEELFAVDAAEATQAAAPEDEGVEPIVMEEEPIVDLSEAVEESEAIDVVDEAEEGIDPEIVDEEESAEEEKPKAKKKKSRAMLFVGLAVGFVLLLGCVGGGYAVYSYINGTLFESDKKPITPRVQPPPGFPPGPRPGLPKGPVPHPTPGQRP
jgi:DNA-directed RNA polymerase subunit RPC12/RpoP